MITLLITKATTFLNNPDFSLLASQIFGLILTMKGLPSDKEIKELSGTYWDFSPPMIRHLLSEKYDKILGIFVITIPTLTAVSNFNNVYINLIIISIGAICSLPSVKNPIVNKKTKKICELKEK